ncbi:hypothetical protein JIG36_34650 [Actinoplanes sp. LDG1-06]|uniref:Uncharacterized protein n=1 Tax=Paractinoplanes ovalisporus TaxID=2810368 RepID=A0ABS2ALD2_9ACTN|nr:hypothetical protein [Actinoplanes ovalisporus]MBM2620653.1 hypothetical protein [Actinoplanes ovalisporus]
MLRQPVPGQRIHERGPHHRIARDIQGRQGPIEFGSTYQYRRRGPPDLWILVAQSRLGGIRHERPAGILKAQIIQQLEQRPPNRNPPIRRKAQQPAGHHPVPIRRDPVEDT